MRKDGDVAARVAVRFDEALESLRLIRVIVDSMPDGNVLTDMPEAPPFKLGLGYVEGWRGPVFVAVESGPDGSIRRCHPHDPSWSALAAYRARGDRQHRSRFSADQQIVQSDVQRARSLTRRRARCSTS